MIRELVDEVAAILTAEAPGIPVIKGILPDELPSDSEEVTRMRRGQKVALFVGVRAGDADSVTATSVTQFVNLIVAALVEHEAGTVNVLMQPFLGLYDLIDAVRGLLHRRELATSGARTLNYSGFELTTSSINRATAETTFRLYAQDFIDHDADARRKFNDVLIELNLSPETPEDPDHSHLETIP